MKLIDTHAHLQMDNYDADRAEVLARSRAAGVERMIIVGTDAAMNQQALDLTRSQDGLFPTVGWHPHDAKDWTPAAWDALCRQAQDPHVVAIGEVGLDYFRNHSTPEQQKEVFRKAIQLAHKTGKPLIVHSRESHADVLALLREEGQGKTPGVLHCFSADLLTAQAAMEIGFYISFSAVITYPKNTALRETAVQIPAERLLVETDCPFLPPQDRRGQRNDPSAVGQVVTLLAQIRGTPLEKLADQIWGNAERLFQLSKSNLSTLTLNPSPDLGRGDPK